MYPLLALPSTLIACMAPAMSVHHGLCPLACQPFQDLKD